MDGATLSNGLRVFSEELPDLGSITIGVWVEHGSGHESANQAGISHFLEHLLFKGTARRTATAIAEEIDAVGGVLNAFTGKEYTCYYGKVLAEHGELLLDLLADILLESLLAPEEIERERSVILQEISQVEDSPDDYVHELFSLAYWPGHPLARPIAGSADTVLGLSREDFLRLLGTRYRANRMIVAAAGRLRHEELVASVERSFGVLCGTARIPEAVRPTAASGLWVHEKGLEQVHLCIGGSGIGHNDPDRYAAHILNVALGGGMSSRLFQEVRERRGLAYSVYSFLCSYLDAGYMGVYAGTSARWVPEVVEVALKEIDRVRREGLPPRDLDRAKSQVKGSMWLGLETSDSQMMRLAKNQIYHSREVPLAEIAAQIDRTSNDDVVRVAERLFRPGTRAVTVLGDLQGEKIDEGILWA